MEIIEGNAYLNIERKLSEMLLIIQFGEVSILKVIIMTEKVAKQIIEK